MSRPTFASLVVVLALTGYDLPLGRAADVPSARRPNFVFFLADDLGWRDTGCYGSTFYETPNIDRLARQGMRFTTAVAARMPTANPNRKVGDPRLANIPFYAVDD